MTPRDVRVTIEDLDAIIYLASVLKDNVPDIYILAHERQVTGDQAPGGRRTEWDNLEGDPAAKDAWNPLGNQRSSTGAKAIRGMLAEHAARFYGLLSGPGADTSLRGTLLGDDAGNGAQRDFTERLKARDRRVARGEYAPNRSEPQPKRVPGAGG